MPTIEDTIMHLNDTRARIINQRLAAGTTGKGMEGPACLLGHLARSYGCEPNESTMPAIVCILEHDPLAIEVLYEAADEALARRLVSPDGIDKAWALTGISDHAAALHRPERVIKVIDDAMAMLHKHRVGDTPEPAQPGQDAYTDLPWAVTDMQNVPVGGVGIVMRRFATEADGAAFIETLPDYATGCYGLDGPSYVEEAQEVLREVEERHQSARETE